MLRHHVANQFVFGFSSVFSRDFLHNPYPLQQGDSKFIFIVYGFDIFQIENVLAKLKLLGRSLPDGTPYFKKDVSIL